MVDLSPVAANSGSADFKICSRRRSRGSLARLQARGLSGTLSSINTSIRAKQTLAYLVYKNTAAGLKEPRFLAAGSAARAKHR